MSASISTSFRIYNSRNYNGVLNIKQHDADRLDLQ